MSEKTANKGGSYVLASGRKVHLMSLNMRGTYAGCLEGSMKTNSDDIRKDLEGGVRGKLNITSAVRIFDDGGEVLPDLQWIAMLYSHEPTKTTDSDFSSELAVCWFSDDVPDNINLCIEELLTKIDWEKEATDYDFTMM